ncbi:hypothetical protein FHS23_000424 [Prauserella isguenensis]|uniref:Uncharacterized protein n=1 Tax=Prauserella isguenensis TaxID=1470180 RepID=A0A839RXS6_9PSEU|nr:hypothetical protein [Prauserella isguenensis]
MPYLLSSCALRSEQGSTSANGSPDALVLAGDEASGEGVAADCEAIGCPPSLEEHALTKTANAPRVTAANARVPTNVPAPPD